MCICNNIIYILLYIILFIIHKSISSLNSKYIKINNIEYI